MTARWSNTQTHKLTRHSASRQLGTKGHADREADGQQVDDGLAAAVHAERARKEDG